jgi:hypothetical protein
VIEAEALRELETRVGHSLATGDTSALDVLGYGEISLVLGWPVGERALACKRLPVFPSAAALEAYRTVLGEYIRRMQEAGIDMVETELHSVPLGDGRFAGYCVQRTLPAGSLVPAMLRAASPADGHPVFAAIADAVCRAACPTMGVDGQLSNWAWLDGKLKYFDVTTPLLRDEAGGVVLDVGLFLAAYPWALRAAIRRFVLPGIVEQYTKPRHILLDLAGNMQKERLDAWLPVALEAINARVTPAITPAEAASYYSGDARLWAVLFALRRADRFWQRHVRRRTYPFLLPGPIAR